MKFFNKHISTEQLADIADGHKKLSNEMEQHLNACFNCSEEFARLETAIGLMRQTDSAAAPPAALRFARNIFRARQQQFTPQTSGFANKIAATLKIDLSAFMPAFGERSSGAAASNERQMLFAAGAYDLDLRIKETENGFTVRGQVLGELTGKCLVHLEGSDFTLDCPVDDAGNFSFSRLSSVDDLQVSLIFVE